MRLTRLPLLVFATTLVYVSGCTRTRTDVSYATAIANVIASDPVVSDLDRLFPGVRHFISHYNEWAGPPRWTSEILIHGRYTLTLQFEIEIDSSGTQVTRTSPARFYLWEVSKADFDSESGQLSMQYSGVDVTFSEVEWQQVVASSGDLSGLGIQLETAEPLPVLVEHW